MEKPVTSPDLVGILKTHIELFRAEEAKRWARINSDPTVRALREEDPDFLREFWPLRTQKRDGVLVSRLGDDYYKVGYTLVKIKDGRYLISIP